MQDMLTFLFVLLEFVSNYGFEGGLFQIIGRRAIIEGSDETQICMDDIPRSGFEDLLAQIETAQNDCADIVRISCGGDPPPVG